MAAAVLLSLGLTACRGSGPGTTSSAAPSGTNGPGVSAAALRIGVIVQTSSGAAAGGAGAAALDTGDNRDQAQAVIQYVNAHGGIAGRRIEPVYETIDLTKFAANPTAGLKALCTTFTVDHPVFAVVGYFGIGTDTLDCLAGHHTALVDDFVQITNADAKKYNDYFYMPSSFGQERLTATIGTGLVASGLLSKSSKVGVLGGSTGQEPYVKDDLTPALAKAGYTVSDAVYYSGNPQQQSQGFVLRFKQEGITDVIPLNVTPLLLMMAAEPQHYRPHYMVNSTLGTGYLQGAAPAGQLAGTMSVGWQPSNDVDAARQPAPFSDNQRLCDQIQIKAGTDRKSQLAITSARTYCDTLFVLAQALKGAKVVNAAVLNQRYNALGSSYHSPLAFQSEPGAGRHDSATAYRLVAFDAGCHCFRYRGGNRPAAP